jgi:hypothetical protein
MPKGVRCLVEECVFNDEHNCAAESIEVESNGNDIVGTSKGTMCGTFRFRDFDDGHVQYHPSVRT